MFHGLSLAIYSMNLQLKMKGEWVFLGYQRNCQASQATLVRVVVTNKLYKVWSGWLQLWVFVVVDFHKTCTVKKLTWPQCIQCQIYSKEMIQKLQSACSQFSTRSTCIIKNTELILLIMHVCTIGATATIYVYMCY